MSTISAIAPKRCFFCDLTTTNPIVANSRQTVRMLGVAVNLVAAVDDVEYPGVADDASSDYQDLRLLTLDDGTATVDIFIPYNMVEKVELLPGQTVECIAWLRQRVNIKKWYAYCITRITDPHAEILRWLELSLPPSSDVTMRTGYPTMKRNATETLRLITVHSRHKSEGVRLKDLALVMQQPEDVVQGMLLELQLNAQIYQNQAGNYVPL